LHAAAFYSAAPKNDNARRGAIALRYSRISKGHSVRRRRIARRWRLAEP